MQQNKNLIKIYLLLFILITIPIYTKSQDSIKVIKDFEQENITFFKQYWQNPAMCFAYPINKISEISFAGNIYNKNTHLAQEGKHKQQFIFYANSFTKKEKYLYQGLAMYSNSLTKNTLWNTSADYKRLLPYLIADTISANTKNETYAFEGAYALKFNKLNLGLQASYRAVKEFRLLDPRPLNNVADLNITLATAIVLNKKYIVGIDILYNHYQQNQTIGIFKQGSAAKIFFLRGFGISEHSFSTVIKNGGGINNIYKQKKYKANINLLPTLNKGLFGNIGTIIENLSLLGDYNDHVSDLKTITLKTEIGKKILLNKSKISLKIFGKYTTLNGNEYNYAFNRKLLNKINKYSNKKNSIGISLLHETHCKTNIYTKIHANIEYLSKKEKYFNLGKTVGSEKISFIDINTTKSFLFLLKKNILLTKIQIGYKHNLSKQLQHAPLELNSAKTSLVLNNYNINTANLIYTNFQCRYDYKIKERIYLFTKLNILYASFIKIANNQQYHISLGLNF